MRFHDHMRIVPASILFPTSFCDMIIEELIRTSSFTFTFSAITLKPSTRTQLPNLQSHEIILCET